MEAPLFSFVSAPIYPQTSGIEITSTIDGDLLCAFAAERKTCHGRIASLAYHRLADFFMRCVRAHLFQRSPARIELGNDGREYHS